MQKVLIIEDDAHTRDGLQELLQLEGYQVRAVPDGNSASCLRDFNDIEIIIADYGLPDTTGIRIMRELTASSYAINTILMTACLTSEIVQQAREAGINSCLSKPLDIDQLLALMQNTSELYEKPAFQTATN